MAMSIQSIPTLTGKVAEEFVRKADEALKKRGTADFSAQAKSYAAIMKKAKL